MTVIYFMLIIVHYNYCWLKALAIHDTLYFIWQSVMSVPLGLPKINK